MGVTTKEIQQVRPGVITEYKMINADIGTDDEMWMCFDSEITIDQIYIKLGTSSDYNYTVGLVYPTTGTEVPLVQAALPASSNLEFFLNLPGTQSWYRLPASACLKFAVTTVTTGDTVDIFVLGR